MKQITAKKISVSSETPLANHNVSMSNSIVSAAHALNLSEKRIICTAIAKLNSLANAPPSKAIKITAMEFAECFKIDETTAYEQLKKGSKNLFSRYISRVQETPYGQKTEQIRWIDRAVYHPGEGYVEINFTVHVSPYLTALEKRFTTYKLEHARALRSIHSWRLFENLKRWESTGVWICEIDEFHHAMEATPSYRKNFAQLRKWVIEPALKELREVSGLEVEFFPYKRGRKVSRLIFKFKPTKQMKMLSTSIDKQPEILENND
jgi:plasmid replication initiation protein